MSEPTISPLPSTHDELRAAYERDGVVVVPGFLDATALRTLRDELRRYIDEVVPTLPATAAFFEDPSRRETLKQLQHMQGDPFFADCCRDERWQGIAERLLGEPASCDSPEWFNKPRGLSQPTPPHQDNYYFCLTPPQVLTIWVALDEVDAENGCLRYVVGSHREGYRSHARSRILGFSQGITDFGPADEAREREVHLHPGDAVIHHGMTIHRAAANRSENRDRRAFAMVFRGASCRRDEQAFARYQEAVRRQHDELGVGAS